MDAHGRSPALSAHNILQNLLGNTMYLFCLSMTHEMPCPDISFHFRMLRFHHCHWGLCSCRCGQRVPWYVRTCNIIYPMTIFRLLDSSWVSLHLGIHIIKLFLFANLTKFLWRNIIDMHVLRKIKHPEVQQDEFFPVYAHSLPPVCRAKKRLARQL